MTAVTIGEMRHCLVIESETRTSDGGGGASEAWSTVGEIWAAVRARGGSEQFEADGSKGRITHEVVIRWRSDLSPAMRFREGERLLDIRAAFDPDDTRRWLKCLCEERTP